jgi:hypothetical protein
VDIEAARGAVIAYGYSGSGNDLEVLYAAGKAERVDGNALLRTRISAADAGLELAQDCGLTPRPR